MLDASDNRLWTAPVGDAADQFHIALLIEHEPYQAANNA
jgi:hypothetical protein